MNKRDILFLISTVIWLTFIGAVTLLNIIQQNYQSFTLFISTIIYMLFIYYIRQRGSIPTMLLRDYTPLPLAIINPPNDELRSKFEIYILPAVQTSIELSAADRPEKAYNIIKRVKEFLEGEIKAINVDKIARKINEMKIYSYIKDEDERKNAKYSLASLIHWIYRYRNLAFHSPRVDADPIDAWFALRTALIYIRDRYKTKKAGLYTRCPHCGAINKVMLEDKNAKWLTELTMECKQCGENYKIKLEPNIIINHYKIKKGKGHDLVQVTIW